jgi:hypothetical protein
MLAMLIERSGLDAEKLTKLIARNTPDSFKSVELRLKRWGDGHPPRLSILERDLAIAGFRLEIVPIDLTPKRTPLDDYQDIVEMMRSNRDTRVRAMLKGKALIVLEGIREDQAGELRLPSEEQIQWWRSVATSADAKWWQAYYKKRVKEGQIGGVDGLTAIVKARFALAIIGGLTSE